MNYGELKQEILDLAKLTLGDVVGARIVKHVQRAEAMIAQHVRAMEMVTSTTLNDAARVSGGLYNLPANYLHRIACFGTHQSQRFKVRLVSTLELHTHGQSSPPYHASILGRQIEFRGAPATGSEFQLFHFARPTAFSADGDTNLLLTNCEALYLHGALHWLYLDAQDHNNAAGHRTLFDIEKQVLNDAAARAVAAGVVSDQYDFGSGGSM